MGIPVKTLPRPLETPARICYNVPNDTLPGEVNRLEHNPQDFLEALILNQYTAMERYAARFFSSRDLAQDAVQETFLIAQKKLGDLTASPNPRGWLFNTLKNVMGSMYKQQRRLSAMAPLEDNTAAAEMSLDPAVAYESAIPREDLELLIWVYCQDVPYAEAARRLDISLDACKKRIQRAKHRLRDALTEVS